MKIKHGYDVGEVSIGWSVLNAETNEIIALGVRAWDKSEDRQGETLAAIRRNKSNARKTLRRRTHRKERVKNLLVNENIITKEDLVYLNEHPEVDIYELRYKAIKEDITNIELARLCIYFAGHRGFKSSDTRGQSDSGVIKKALSENRKLMKENGYITFGEMLCKDSKFKNQKKNKSGDYTVSIDRDLINEEIKYILNKQCKNTLFIDKYISILNSQRSFATGEDILGKVGFCTFETKEKRCAKASISFQRFRAMQDLTKIKLIDNKLESRCLTEEEKNILTQEIFNKNKVTYKDVRKLLNIDKEILFSNINYDKEKETKEVTNVSDFNKLKTVFKSLKLNILDFEDNLIDSIAHILTVYKVESEIISELSKLNLNNDIIEELKEVNFTKFSHLSLTAVRKINIGLSKGMTYDKACEYVGYHFKNENLNENKKKRLPGFNKNEITDKNVYKTCVEFRKVMNALIDKYGSPYKVHIESTRDLGMSDKKKAEMEKNNTKNEKLNKALIEEIKEIRGVDQEPTQRMISRYRLYKEQNGICMYSGKQLDLITMLYDEKYAEIDHILPRSRSFDDKRTNKVLVLTSENQNKKNQTPYEYFGENEYKWHQFEQRVLTSNLHKTKKQNLLNKTFKDNEKGFLDRNLHNTSWAIRSISNHVRQNLLFVESDKKNVVEVSGRLTSQIRYLLGIDKDREENDLHHAVDAVIVALCDNKTIQAYSKYWSNRENKLRYKFEQPYENFVYDLNNKLQNVIVSRPEVKKKTGQVFDDTIYGYGGTTEDGKEIYTYKTKVSDIKFDKNGDFKMFNKDGNLDAYNSIKRAYLNKSLDNVIGKNGLPIKKITQFDYMVSGNMAIMENSNGGKSVRIGGNMKRVDVYSKDKKYYCVPIYYSDLNPSNRYIIANKPKSMWEKIDESYNFEFSLFKNSLVSITSKKEDVLFYYTNMDTSSAKASGHILNSKNDKFNIGTKTLLDFKKMKIDILGNIVK